MSEEVVKRSKPKRAPAATRPKQPANPETATALDILPDLHWAFVQEYLTDFRGTRAYMKVYGMTDEKTAAVCASQLLTKLNIREAVEFRLRELAVQYGVQQLQVLQYYARIAFFDPRRLYDENGDLKKVKDLGDDEVMAIKSIEHKDLYEGFGETRKIAGYIHKVIFHDRIEALKRLELYVTGIQKNREDAPEEAKSANVQFHFHFPEKYPLEAVQEADVVPPDAPPRPQNGEPK